MIRLPAASSEALTLLLSRTDGPRGTATRGPELSGVALPRDQEHSAATRSSVLGRLMDWWATTMDRRSAASSRKGARAHHGSGLLELVHYGREVVAGSGAPFRC
jgi:hypothetical protein